VHKLSTHFAILTVMMHMTFGCAWHHGLSTPHHCHADSAHSALDVDEPTQSNDDGHCCGCSHSTAGSEDLIHSAIDSSTTWNSPNESALTLGCDSGDHSHDHATCRNDRCVFKETCCEEFIRHLEFNQMLQSMILNSTKPVDEFHAGFAFDNGAIKNVAPGMRAHLYFGVLIL
jgi:hypothetical protein